MITPQPDDEASEIIEIIDKYFPKIFEANRSIEWLHKYTRQGKQPEWQGFFFEEYSFPLLTNFLGGWYGVRIIKGCSLKTNNFPYDNIILTTSQHYSYVH